MKSLLRTLFFRLFKVFIIRKAEPGAVYLTYDDGPHPENTTKILRELERYQAMATFFMVGKNMEAYPEIVEAVIRAGHTVGYHSYRHRSLRKCSLAEVRQDMAMAKQLSARFNYPIKLYRPPFGHLTPLTFLWLLSHGMKIVMWSLDCRDSFDSIDEVKASILPERLEDGEIILLHDDYANAGELIESSLKQYRQHQLVCRGL